MKSKASIKSHPLHPILISFPIGLLLAALLSDIIFRINDEEIFFEMGGYLEIAGIVSGFIAAVPGVIDYIFTVPPQSSAKKRATKHGLINVIMLIAFIAAYLLRNNASFNLVLALELAGAVLMMIAGWLGGTLVHRNLIGVDMRYANAGKWKELFASEENGLIKVADAGELEVDQMKLIHFNGKRIVLARTENQHVAFDDRCPHRGGSLAGGMMICGTVQCPWHGSQFDVCTGAVKAGPAKEKIESYPVVEKDGKIYLNPIRTS